MHRIGGMCPIVTPCVDILGMNHRQASISSNRGQFCLIGLVTDWPRNLGQPGRAAQKLERMLPMQFLLEWPRNLGQPGRAVQKLLGGPNHA